MQIKGKYAWLKHLDFMVVDLVSLFVAFLLAYRLKFGNFNFARFEDWTRYILIVSLLSLVVTLFVNPYSGILRRSYYMDVVRGVQLAAFNFLLVGVILYLLKIGAQYSREMTIYMYLFYFLLATLAKYVWKRLLMSGKVVIFSTKKIPLFIIGCTNDIEKTIRNVLAGDFQLYEILGIHLVDNAGLERLEINLEGPVSIPVVDDGYEHFILDNNIGEVLFAVSPGLIEASVCERLTANGVGLNMVVELAIGFQPEDQYIQNFGVYKALSVGAFSFTPGQMLYLGIKRIVDVIAGVAGLALLVPVTLLVKLVFLLSGDREPVFYRQTRVGQNGRTIRIWKYRSMVPNAEEMLREMLKDERYRREWEENQKFENDPRVTRFGRFLRKTSLDELPQLMNVLVGDMSLVGPRPLVIGELEQHDGLKLYQKVKPGITGWWGCNGRSNIDYRERLELEYYYVKNCSFYLDLLCIMRTVFAVLKKEGAQ